MHCFILPLSSPPHPLIPARSYFEINSRLVSSVVRLSVSRNELELCLSLPPVADDVVDKFWAFVSLALSHLEGRYCVALCDELAKMTAIEVGRFLIKIMQEMSQFTIFVLSNH